MIGNAGWAPARLIGGKLHPAYSTQLRTYFCAARDDYMASPARYGAPANDNLSCWLDAFVIQLRLHERRQISLNRSKVEIASIPGFISVLQGSLVPCAAFSYTFGKDLFAGQQ